MIARGPMGFCCCGLQIEPGEQFEIRSGSATHVGCRERSRDDQQPASGNEWSLTAVPAPPVVKTRERRTTAYRPVSLSGFDGPTLTAADTPRLAGQLQRTYDFMSDGEWHTLNEVADVIDGLETSAGARLRDLRKEQFGGHVIECRLSTRIQGIREYRLDRNGARNAA